MRKIVHDIRNGLVAVLQFADTISGNDPDPKMTQFKTKIDKTKTLLNNILHAQEETPIAEPTKREETPPLARIESILTGKHILVIDDEIAVSSLLESVFKLAKTQADVICNNYDELLEGAAEIAADEIGQTVAMLDMNIDGCGKTGLQIAAELRKSYPAMKIILMSANDRQDLGDLSAVDRYLRKPFSIREIAEVFEALFAEAQTPSSLP